MAGTPRRSPAGGPFHGRTGHPQRVPLRQSGSRARNGAGPAYFYLGSPHLGAPLARAARFAGWALGKAPETRPLATLVNGSSPGIKDLRHGYLLSDDWDGRDQDNCLADHRSDVPLLAGACHYTVGATVTADPASPLGGLVGDLLVRPTSAHGRRGRRQHIPFSVESGRGPRGMHHQSPRRVVSDARCPRRCRAITTAGCGRTAHARRPIPLRPPRSLARPRRTKR